MSSPLIITKLIGGLGNQLFQYALGRQLAQLNDGVLKLDISGFQTYRLHRYSLDHFDIAASVATRREVARFSRLDGSALRIVASRPAVGVTRFGNRSYVRETSLAFDERVLRLRGSLYLEGYWQSEKYFRAIRDELRSELVIASAPDVKNRDMAAKLKAGPSASVHVRLGDYASDPSTKQVHGVLPIDYYQRAVDHILRIEPQTQFFLFSDEPERAAEMIRIPGARVTTVAINDASRNFEDLRLMTLADHHVVANSSFSWWGAWLREAESGVVIAPRGWFADESRDSTDIIPPSWTAL